MSIVPTPNLIDGGLPAIHDAADRASEAGQAETRRTIRWELRLVVIAAITGVGSWQVDGGRYDVLAGIGSGAFVIALVLTLVRAARKPEEAWYRGRAVAESAKTLAWRYAVGGDPFPQVISSAQNEQRLLDRLQSLVDAMDTLRLPRVGPAHDQVTDAMKGMRSSSLDDRKLAYRTGRVQDQINWYLQRAGDHERSAKRWGFASIAANVAGVAGGLLRFFGAVEVDLLGVAAALAGAATAWTQLHQHRGLATSYSVTAQELAIVKSRLDAVTSEPEWALYVSDAEDAISREHTMWLARHGHPGLSAK